MSKDIDQTQFNKVNPLKINKQMQQFEIELPDQLQQQQSFSENFRSPDYTERQFIEKNNLKNNSTLIYSNDNLLQLSHINVNNNLIQPDQKQNDFTNDTSSYKNNQIKEKNDYNKSNFYNEVQSSLIKNDNIMDENNKKKSIIEVNKQRLNEEISQGSSNKSFGAQINMKFMKKKNIEDVEDQDVSFDSEADLEIQNDFMQKSQKFLEESQQLKDFQDEMNVSNKQYLHVLNEYGPNIYEFLNSIKKIKIKEEFSMFFKLMAEQKEENTIIFQKILCFTVNTGLTRGYTQYKGTFDFISKDYQNPKKWSNDYSIKILKGQMLQNFFNDIQESLEFLQRNNFKHIQKIIIQDMNPHLQFEFNSEGFSKNYLRKMDLKESAQQIVKIIKYFLENKDYKIAKRILHHMVRNYLVRNKFIRLNKQDTQYMIQILNDKFFPRKTVDIELADNFDSCSSYIFMFCYFYGKKYIIFPETAHHILMAYKSQCFKFMKTFCTLQGMETTNVEYITCALDFMEKQDTFIHGIYGLNFLDYDNLNQLVLKRIYNSFLKVLKNNLHLIHMTPSPFQIAIAMANISEQIRKNFKRQSIYFEFSRDKYIDLAIKLMSEIKDFLVLEETYMQKLYPLTESPYNIILNCQEGFKKILELDCFLEISESQYIGQNDLKFREIFQSCSAYLNLNLEKKFILKKGKIKQMLKKRKIKTKMNTLTNFPTQVAAPNIYQNSSKFSVSQTTSTNSSSSFNYNSVDSYLFSYKRTNKNNIKENHIFQFDIWRQSPFVITLINILINSIFLFLITVITLRYFSKIRTVTGLLTDEFLTYEEEFRSIVSTDVLSDEQYQIMVEIFTESLGSNFTTLNQQQQYDFIYEQKKIMAKESFWDALARAFPQYQDLITNILTEMNNLNLIQNLYTFIPIYYLLISIQSFFEIANLFKTEYEISYSKRQVVDFVMLIFQAVVTYIIRYRISSDDYSWLQRVNYLDIVCKMVAISLFLILQRVLQMLKLTKRFGVFIKLIEMCFLDLFNFLIIFILQLLVFTCVFYSLFSDKSDNFSTFYNTIVTLNYFVLGTLDADFTSEEDFGSMCIILYTYINNVMFLNILIAILSNTFQRVTEKSNTEYGKLINNERKFVKPTELYTGLVAMPAPFNIITIPFQSMLLFKDSVNLNDCVLKLCYFLLVVILIFPIYFTVNFCVFVPFSYLNQFRNIFKHGYDDIFMKFFKAFIWIFIGLIYCYFVFFTNDLYYFVLSLTKKVKRKQFLEEFDDDHVSNTLFLIQKMKYKIQQKFDFPKIQKIESNQKSQVLQQIGGNFVVNDFIEQMQKYDFNQMNYEQYGNILDIFCNFNNEFNYEELINVIKQLRKYCINIQKDNVWTLSLYHSQWIGFAILKYQKQIIKKIYPSKEEVNKLEKLKFFHKQQ